MGIAVSVLCVAAFVVLDHEYPFPIARLTEWPASPRVLDAAGQELFAVTNRGEQWRFPVALEEMSPWLRKATVAIEDERFFGHPGVDPVAVARAVGQNVAAGRIQSGASTITMQVCVMMERRSRTFRAKAIEAFRALQLERIWSKDEILCTYLNIAPYGGNMCGVEAAARGYFGKSAADLTLAEAALLAGLPQSPSRYRPDRNLDLSIVRRRMVLERMLELGMIDRETYFEAVTEPVVLSPLERRAAAPHAAWMVLSRANDRGGAGAGVARTTLDGDLQRRVEQLVGEHAAALPARSDVAVVVLDIATGGIKALVGSADFQAPASGQVNGAIARRSPGSALKPFIYAAAFESGVLAPESTVFDVPISRGGWTPRNFDRVFSGAVSASEALQRSLNIPAILVAERVGAARCAGYMEAAGVRLPVDTASRTGLALAVGGAEVTLLDLVNGYATIGRGGVCRPPVLLQGEASPSAAVLDAAVCANLDDILSTHRRRPAGMADLSPEAIPWFMWKTGTSSGRRDAWAVGHNGVFAIGVWVGRFEGAASHQFVGGLAAEPLLARLFDLPAIRRAGAPAPPPELAVAAPMPPPREMADGLRILQPRDGAVYVALNGTAPVSLEASRLEGLTWFLDGVRLAREAATGLSLPVGRHAIGCVDSAGRGEVVQVTVVSRLEIGPSADRQR